jgi:hypothetical protein
LKKVLGPICFKSASNKHFLSHYATMHGINRESVCFMMCPVLTRTGATNGRKPEHNELCVA